MSDRLGHCTLAAWCLAPSRGSVPDGKCEDLLALAQRITRMRRGPVKVGPAGRGIERQPLHFHDGCRGQESAAAAWTSLAGWRAPAIDLAPLERSLPPPDAKGEFRELLL